MAIGFERQQKSLIGGNLPQARIDVSAPDLSGLQRLGTTMVNVAADEAQRKKARAEAEAREKQDITDTVAGQTAGSDAGRSWIGKDEANNPVEFTLPEGTAAYQRGYLSGFEQAQDARFRTSIETRFADIQARFVGGEITAEQADALMQSHLEGQIENTPAHRRGYYAEVGQVELLQRSGLMKTQQAAKREQAVAGDLAAIIKSTLEEASSHAAVGGDPAAYLARIDQSYDALIQMGRIGETEAGIAKANVRQLITGQALVNRLTTAMAKGEMSPADVDRFGTAIETNDGTAEAIVNKVYRVGPNARATMAQGYRSKDVFTNITSEEIRKDMGLKLRQAATDWKQKAATQANAEAFGSQLSYLASDEGRMAALPSEYHDDADDMMASYLTAPVTALTIPADREQAVAVAGQTKALMEHLAHTKYVPKPLAKALEAMAGSQNPAEVERAVQVYRELITYTSRGVAVGDLLRNSLPDDTKTLLGSIEEGFRLGMSAAEVSENLKTARGKEEFTLGRLIATYNAHAEDDDGFWKKLRTQWTDDYDVLPDPEVKDAFGTAFRHSMIALRDPEKAFAKAYEMVKTKYRKSDLMLNGLESGSGLLTNPEGYEVQRPGGLFGAAAGSEYEWINNTVRGDVVEALTSGRLLMPGRMGEEEMTPEGFTGLLEDPNWIGKTAKLVPVQGSNPDMPEYALRMFDAEGNDLGPLLQTDDRGRVSPFTVNPHIERAQAGAKFSAQSMLKANEAAANESLMRLEDRILNQLTPEQQSGYRSNVPLADYLPSVAPQLTEEYRLERSQIEEGLINARKLYEEQTGEVPPPSKIGPQTLVTPRAAGFDVAATAASLVDRVLPDGTGGTFLLRIAAQESNFGKAAGTFRLRGDKGMTQVNTGSGFKEVKRRVAMGKGRVWAAAQVVKRELGIDVDQITAADLDKPLVAMAVARLYVEAVGRSVPQDVAGQAAWWKRHYNTYLGAGTPEEFMRSARKVPDNWQTRVKVGG